MSSPAAYFAHRRAALAGGLASPPLLWYRAAAIGAADTTPSVDGSYPALACWRNQGTATGDTSLQKKQQDCYVLYEAGAPVSVLQVSGANSMEGGQNVGIVGNAARTLAFLFEPREVNAFDLLHWGDTSGANTVYGLSCDYQGGIILNLYNYRIQLASQYPAQTTVGVLVSGQVVGSQFVLGWYVSDETGRVLGQGTDSSIPAAAVATRPGPLNIGEGFWAGRGYAINTYDFQLYDTALGTADFAAIRSDWNELTTHNF